SDRHVRVLLFSRLASRSFCPDAATPGLYTLSLHDALPILTPAALEAARQRAAAERVRVVIDPPGGPAAPADGTITLTREQAGSRSEEHTSELQSLAYLVCRLLLEKKKKKMAYDNTTRDI